MRSVYDELTRQGQATYNGIRRKMQFFETFAGGVIEALREAGFRLCSFEKQPEGQQGAGNIELFFEEGDHDQRKVLIVPYRNDLAFLAKGRFVAQLGLEMSRYSNDPDTLRQAMAVNAKAAFGGLLGGARLPRLYLDSPSAIRPPGTMTFELRGARLVVSMNVLVNLGKYRLSDFELDTDSIGEDLQVYFYGLERYLTGLVSSFAHQPGQAPHESEPPPSPSEPPPAPLPDEAFAPPQMGGAPRPPAPPSGVFPLD